ncbi:MAG: AlpA family transcriptional regulator [Rudaea sp.]|uniref:AlpA family transcriptional regulator n=1 Tax=unclassified Rudaea TaxID=2627037 RepID=UPI001ACABC0B|nr:MULTISPECIES: AlpA family transcriptional regulator [unclassified Rudaea]MBN8888465.1 AlpA family transcriptional regulator [Rudaea sp.]MBR0347317.1 AlpA family transcriptional regulator [Rudaea sp.]
MNLPIRMLRLPDVLQKTGLSRSQIYRLIALGCFPTQVQLSDRAAGWVELEIDQWLQKKIDVSRGTLLHT